VNEVFSRDFYFCKSSVLVVGKIFYFSVLPTQQTRISLVIFLYNISIFSCCLKVEVKMLTFILLLVGRNFHQLNSHKNDQQKTQLEKTLKIKNRNLIARD
jgi:hypothetical protein